MMIGSRVNTDDSMKHHPYFVLDSPRHAFLSPSMLSFGIMFFGSGVILGSMWNGISPQTEIFSLKTERDFTSIRDEEVSFLGTSLREDQNSSPKLAWLVSGIKQSRELLIILPSGDSLVPCDLHLCTVMVSSHFPTARRALDKTWQYTRHYFD